MIQTAPAIQSPEHESKRVRVGRSFLFAMGLSLIAWLVHLARTGRVVMALHGALRWLPIVALFETAFVGIDVLALGVLLGDAQGRMPLRMWLRGALLAYAASVFLPMGRAAGETVRAASIAPHVGTAWAASACTRLQACALVGNASISLAAASAALRSSDAGHFLVLALLANAFVCIALATALFTLLRSGRFAAWLRRRFPRLANQYPAKVGDPLRQAIGIRSATWATLLCIGARVLQLAQYGVILRAIGLTPTLRRALGAQGIHLAGAAAGDFIPNQMGATEGAYFKFASVVGLGEEPARALSIALIAHFVQLSLAVACVLAASLVVAHPAKAVAR